MESAEGISLIESSWSGSLPARRETEQEKNFHLGELLTLSYKVKWPIAIYKNWSKI